MSNRRINLKSQRLGVLAGFVLLGSLLVGGTAAAEPSDYSYQPPPPAFSVTPGFKSMLVTIYASPGGAYTIWDGKEMRTVYGTHRIYGYDSNERICITVRGNNPGTDWSYYACDYTE